jgi:hypothetical protein
VFLASTIAEIIGCMLSQPIEENTGSPHYSHQEPAVTIFRFKVGA